MAKITAAAMSPRWFEGGEAVIRKADAQQLLIDLPRGADRNFVDDHHVVRHPPPRDLTLEKPKYFVAVDGLTGLQFYDQKRPLRPFRMVNPDHGRASDLGVSDK